MNNINFFFDCIIIFKKYKLIEDKDYELLHVQQLVKQSGYSIKNISILNSDSFKILLLAIEDKNYELLHVQELVKQGGYSIKNIYLLNSDSFKILLLAIEDKDYLLLHVQ
jgi:hypothetical protein